MSTPGGLDAGKIVVALAYPMVIILSVKETDFLFINLLGFSLDATLNDIWDANESICW